MSKEESKKRFRVRTNSLEVTRVTRKTAREERDKKYRELLKLGKIYLTKESDQDSKSEVNIDSKIQNPLQKAKSSELVAKEVDIEEIEKFVTESEGVSSSPLEEAEQLVEKTEETLVGQDYPLASRPKIFRTPELINPNLRLVPITSTEDSLLLDTESQSDSQTLEKNSHLLSYHSPEFFSVQGTILRNRNCRYN